MFWTGSQGASVEGDVCMLDDGEPTPGFTWPTMAEILEEASISWKV